MKRGREESTLKLYPHQKTGIRAILSGFHESFISRDNMIVVAHAFLLHDEMGLGKTIQALQAVQENNCSVKLPTLVVCPAGVSDIWTSGDVDRYFSTAFSDVRMVRSKGTRLLSLTEHSLIVVSYELLGRAFRACLSDGTIAENLRVQAKALKTKSRPVKDNFPLKLLYRKLFMQEWGHIILDEVHKIKNSSSVSTKAVACLRGCYRLGLTGTPLMNSPLELLTILRYGLGLFRLDFDQMRSNPTGAYTARVLKTFTLGRTRSMVDVGQAKRAKSDQIVELEWGPEFLPFRRAYQQLKLQSLAMIQKIDRLVRRLDESEAEFQQRCGQMKRSFFTTVQRLRQACLHPALVCDAVQPDLVSPKMAWIKTLLAERADEKIVLVSTYRRFFEKILGPWLDRLKVGHALYCGGDKKRQRTVLEEFATKPEMRVLLLVKTAGALGLNLQDSASTIVVLDPHFNSALDAQAVHRVDRIGQTEEVTVKRLFMKGSIDAALLQMQRAKDRACHLGATWEQTNLSYQSVSLHLKELDTV